MNIIYIFGITILLTGGTDSLIEDAKSDKNIQQRILLRKLQIVQPEQEVKPSTWNEVLADVLVNKIRIFSFKNQDKEDVIKEDTTKFSKDRTILVNLIGNVLFVYKKFIYDAFVGKHTSDDVVNVTPIMSDSTEGIEAGVNFEAEDIITPSEVTFKKGPKSEVELVEPQYHGKITIEDATRTNNPDINDSDLRKKSTDTKDTNNIPETLTSTDSEIINLLSDTKNNIDGKQDDILCATGFIKGENGDCVKSRFIMAIPNQCPIGYRMDFLGNCRMIYNF